MKGGVGEAGEEEVQGQVKRKWYFFLAISESFLCAFRGNYLSSNNLAYSSEADSTSAMRCPVCQSSFVCKQEMVLFTQFSNPLTKTRTELQQNCSPAYPYLKEELHGDLPMVQVVINSVAWTCRLGEELHHSQPSICERDPGPFLSGVPISVCADITFAWGVFDI